MLVVLLFLLVVCCLFSLACLFLGVVLAVVGVGMSVLYWR